MKFAKLAIVSAVLAAFSAPVLAQATLKNTTNISNTVSVTGGALVTGVIPVGAEAGAVASNAQGSAGNLVITIGGGNDASVANSANGITGNAGINTTAGTGNAQSNETAVASLEDAASVFASAQTFSTQVSAVNTHIALFTDNAATLDHSVNHAVGNVGVNIAAGSGNMQDNQLAAASRTGWIGSGTVAKATGSNEQVVALTLNADVGFTMTNAATITGSLTSASGSVGANVAAGYGNLQHNSLSIASAR
jgi:hypothetical protein